MPAIDNAFNDDSRPLSRALTRLAHLMRPALLVWALLCLPYYVGITHWALDLTSTAMILVVLVSLFHDSLARLCVHCMAEVPADAPLRAQRQDWLLLARHRPGRWLLAFLAADIGGSILINTYGWPRLLALPGDMLWLIFMYTGWFHHRMRPWCPYCKDWGDGGMREPSPDPTIKAAK